VGIVHNLDRGKYPLGHEHINVLGRYTFALADGIAQGELRPLRHPEDSDDLTVGAA
jgi:hypothetical protein